MKSKNHDGNKEPINLHGGWRPGAGRKKTLINAHSTKVYIDPETRKFYEDLAEGNFSAGVRQAREIIEGTSKRL